jgi:asparagine synthase (glutamine-hydrolysing)
MCGICGIAPREPAELPAADVVRSMTRTLRHRGPDGEGFHLAPGIGLGVRRLAIIDLETGNQPLASEDGAVTVIGNGEIYNHAELRGGLEARGHRFRSRSDVEVIAHLYEDEGLACVERLRGMFAFALWDAGRRRLVLARDRLGIKPLYYAVAGDALYFGSEQKAILAAGGVARDVDSQGLRDLATLGFVAGERTLLARIRQVLPAHYLVWEAGRLTAHRYWDLRFPVGDAPHPRAPRSWGEELRDRLEASVRLHLASDVPVGAWLSPGIDSSAVTALMSRMVPGPLSTYSLTFEGHERDEVRAFGTLDRHPGYGLDPRLVACGPSELEHLPEAVWHAETPAALILTLPRLALARSTTEALKVVLTGEGSDELFGGYPWFRIHHTVARYASWPPALRWLAGAVARALGKQERTVHLMRTARPMDPARYTELVGPATGRLPSVLLSGDLRRRLADAASEGPAWTDPPAFRSWSPAHQLHYYDTTVFMPNYVVPALDRASMAHSVEARVPFLDHELVEFCATIPPDLVLHRGEEKHVLRQALRGVLPTEIVSRRKRPFVAPAEGWFGHPLPDRLEHLLQRESLLATGYFDADAVTAMLAAHRAGRQRRGRLLLSVLGLQLWHEQFVRGGSPA